MTALAQIESYAYAVAADERFRDTETRWEFWLISNEMDEQVQWRARQKGKPSGLTYEADDGRTRIWVKSWGQIIQECKARLKFYEDHLQYQPDYESALQYLRKRHGERLPECLKSEPVTDAEASG